MITLDNIIFLVLVALFLNTIINLKRMTPEDPSTWSGDWPFVSVLVPVRNEENNIQRLIHSLLAQDYPHFEIIVVDDASTDRTWPLLQELAEHHPRLRIFKSQDLPSGWTGKNWACHQLSRLAKGEIFLFTDADTCHSPQALKQAVASARRHQSDLLSAIPRLEAKTWSEKLYMPIIPLALVSLIPFFRLNRKKGRCFPAVLGPFLLIPRSVYESTGGHETFKDNVVDDISLARQLIRHGKRTNLLDGSQMYRLRFYTCFHDLWAGFSKNNYEAIKGTPVKIAGILIGCYLLFLHPFLWLIDSLYHDQLASLALLQVSVILLTRLLLAERFGSNFFWTLLHPVSICLALLILLNSFRLSLLRKKISWKERLYPIP